MSFLTDIQEQPSVLRRLVETYQSHALWQRVSPAGPERPVVLTGMGASYHALYPIWLYLNQQGIPAIAVEASELVYYAMGILETAALLVVVSQSGESVEIRRLLEKVAGRLSVVSVTNHRDNFLADHSNVTFTTESGPEVGVATKTYTSSLALLHLLARHLGGDLQEQDYLDLLKVADLMEIWLSQGEVAISSLYQHWQSLNSFSFIGRGPAMASAGDAALVFKEAARLATVSLSAGQFRHGPMEAVSSDTGILVFINGESIAALNQRLAIEIAEHGGQVIVVGSDGIEPLSHPQIVSLVIPRVDESLSPLLNILPVQLLAAKFALRAGIEPGEFRWGGKVVHVE